jgi:DNA segregation ATPase FtsK/SpoIIIE-like protein
VRRCPTSVGLVTDLDDRRAVSALRALQGEVRRRERLLRAAGEADLAATAGPRRGAPLPPLPRLVVVVDELATLATELPKFLDALLDVAQRGRALGLHLLLATQRPRGVVGANIRTNVSLRIALRVHDASDSLDVIDSDAAAGIPPDLRGRAYLRAGPGDLRAVQAALVTGTTPTESPELTVLSFGGTDGWAANGTRDEPRVPDDHEPSDLARVVAAVRAAFESEEQPQPPALWTDDERGEVAIPSVGLFDLLGIADAAAIDRHKTWRPRPRGDHLRVPIGVDDDGRPVTLDLKESAFDGMGPHGLVVGATGSGKSELLRTLVLALATTHSPEALSLVLVDFKGGATFAGMARLPHVSGVITNLADDLALVDRMRDAMYGEQRAPPGAAQAGRQPGLGRRLQPAAGRRRAPPATAQPAGGGGRVRRASRQQARLHRPVLDHRPAGPQPRDPPPPGLAAPGRGPAARAREQPALPDRPAHVQPG